MRPARALVGAALSLVSWRLTGALVAAPQSAVAPNTALLSVLAWNAAITQPSPPRAKLTEDLRLDATREDFPLIGRVYVGPHGKMAIPVNQDMQIRVYDSTGKRTTVVGRKGQGPGEFTSLSNIGWLADTMWVTDVIQRRFTYVGPDGKVLRTTAHPILRDVKVSVAPKRAPAPITYYFASAIRADGSVFGEGGVKQPGTPLGERRGNPAFIQLNASGSPRALMMLPANQGSDERYYMTAGGLANPIPFVAEPTSAISSQGDYIAFLSSRITSPTGGIISIALMRTTGDTIFAKTFPFKGERIPQHARDSALTAIIGKPGEQTEGPSNLRQQFQAVAKRKMPLLYSGAESLILGLDNTVWIGLHPTSEGQPTLVLTAKGEPVAMVLIPRGSRLRQAAASHVWMSETDSDGLVSIVRYRVNGLPVQPPAG